jgi:glucose PTS system EIICBA or EIICB component
MSFFHRAFSQLQKVGQSLMIPVSVLPAAGLLVAFGRILKDHVGTTGVGHAMAEIMFSGGLAIFEQLPVVFAMGVAVGFTSGAGVAALSAGVGYFTLFNVLKVMSGLNPDVSAINTGVFGGILIGAVTAWLYNRFYQTRLPQILGFFSGKRLVPILSAAAAIVLGIILGFVWPPVQEGIKNFGIAVMSSDFGPALYAAGKRLLIPLGLHHVFYAPFLFDFGEFVNSTGQVLKGESARYFGGDPSAGKFMASEFPLMLYGLPMAALAMFLRAKPENRKAVGGMMLSAALTSIITGITEPIEFAFIFVAPWLYVLHVCLAFVSGSLTSFFDVHLGYTFSASLIDWGLGYFNQKNSAILAFVIGPIMGAIYFASFYFLIGRLNLKTPGREDVATDDEAQASGGAVSKNLTEKAVQILEAIGGAANLIDLEACITRLRISLVDPQRVNKVRLKELGAAGVMQSGPNMQIIFGVESDQIKGEMQKLRSTLRLKSPIEGDIVSLSQVPDDTFAQKILGDGFAINPTSGIVTAPCEAEVLHVFPTGHAVALKSQQGLEILIHIGVDTVKMKGEGFTALVKVGDKVKLGQKLIEFNLELVKQKAKSILTPVIITNMDVVASIKQTALGADIKLK